MIYTVKNVGFFIIIEIPGYGGILYKDEEKIGSVLFLGGREEVTLSLDTPKLEDELREYASSLTYKSSNGEDLPMSTFLFLEQLVLECEELRANKILDRKEKIRKAKIRKQEKAKINQRRTR